MSQVKRALDKCVFRCVGTDKGILRTSGLALHSASRHVATLRVPETNAMIRIAVPTIHSRVQTAPPAWEMDFEGMPAALMILCD